MSSALPANLNPDLNQDLLANTVVNGLFLKTIAASSGGGSGGGGAVTIADGADKAQGSTTDSPLTVEQPQGTLISRILGLQLYLDPNSQGANNSLLNTALTTVEGPINDSLNQISISASSIDGNVSSYLSSINSSTAALYGTIQSTFNSNLSSLYSTPPVSTVSNTPAISSSTTALSANSSRKSWAIQNCGTNPLFIRMGSGATTTAFHRIVKAGVSANDGTGGTFEDNQWQGAITIAGTSPSYTVTELT